MWPSTTQRQFKKKHRLTSIEPLTLFCAILMVTTQTANASKWDLFSSPSTTQMSCFLKNGLKEDHLETLRSGKPEDKKLRKKAKKVMKNCRTDGPITNDVKNSGKILKASSFGGDLQVLKIREEFLEKGTTMLVVPNKTQTGRIVEIDRVGDIIWEFKGNKTFGRLDDAKLTPSRSIIIAAENGAYEIDRSGKLIWSYAGNVSHDIDRLANGNTILNYAWGPKGSDKILEVDPAGRIVWSWNGLVSHNLSPFNDAYAKDADIHGAQKTWIHNNGVTVLEDDLILLSLRDFQEIVWINREGIVLKRYGFECKSPKRALKTLGKIKGCNPHEPQVLENGNIVVGLRNPDRAIEFDPITHEITWEWRSHDKDLYGTIRDVDKLKNGNYQVVTGGHLLEISGRGEILLDIGVNPSLSNDHRILYKAQKIYSDGTLGHD